MERAGDAIGASHGIIAKEGSVGEHRNAAKSSIVFRCTVKETIAPSQVLDMMELDFNEQKGSDEKLSQEDIRFLDILESGIKIAENGHYQMPLPLKGTTARLPNNRNMAVKRLDQLARKLKKGDEFCELYTEFMSNMLEKGYAERVPNSEIQRDDGQVWYVPHHGVCHPRKPNKVRVVFDCSAKHGGQSLNDHLLQGPDLGNKLIGVLTRFRQEPVALTCDIEAMYHQFMVNPDQRDYLRFLWWEDGKLDSPPTEYRMAVHLFGAVSSPACATYALRQIATDHKTTFGEEASQFIMRDFYVDDGLRSVKDTETAIDLVKRSAALCAAGGLHLHKFLSNSKEVLEAIHPKERAANISSQDLLDALPAERVLGVHWNVEEDTLGFKLELKPCQALTRRKILSTVSSIYDPLGLIAPVILIGKQVLQEMCRENLGWDEALPDTLRPRWEDWVNELLQLQNLRVDRCYKPPGFGELQKAELHHFSDASLQGYGECSYLRLVNRNGHIHCALVMAKSRVTPRKAVTVPRLELTAAVVAVKVSQFLQKEMSYPNITHHFWTDSQVVLSYIANEASRFHIYVANRIQAIRNVSEPQQWHHVRTKENPADLASRGCSIQELLSSPIWFRGPNFLWEERLPEGEKTEELPPDDPEVRKRCLATSKQQGSSLLARLERYSSWSKIRRIVSLCLNIKQVITRQLKPCELTPADLKAAETIIIRMVQSHAFSSDIEALLKAESLPQGSSITKLDPFLDDKGILRVGGRLRHSSLPFEVKHPVLLPKHHHITMAVLRYYHKHSAHQGRGTTISALREGGYWVIGASRTVSSLINNCVVCRKLKGRSSEQKMADLPADRLLPAPPFTYSGVDYFGPFLIREGRRNVKRWGVMFTCMASRAVHIEVASSLSTDGFLNVLRRFISLRGNVRHMHSDRGTNFVGAERELKEALTEIEDDQVRRFLAESMCEFQFNPPHASHMGGVWERQIRTARNILSSMLHDSGGNLDDDSLRTLMAETSAIMNSRPLSPENLNDPNSLAAITPNNLLTMKTSVIVPPPGNFQRTDEYSRKRWRRVQHLANVFWSRWRKEFLQQLQQRQKWTQPKRSLKVGDVVLMKDDDLPRGQWRLARVRETGASPDGLTRRVKVAVGSPTLDSKGHRKGSLTILERPIHKLVLLVEAPDQ
jgi:hypothetical protein